VKEDFTDYTTEEELNMLLEAHKPPKDFAVMFQELLQASSN
jgi:hypothetical protein